MAERGRAADRFLEVIAVILLGVATVGTAWCALQSSLWSGESSRLAAEADGYRVEANRQSALAAQALSYDASVVADYAQAVADGNIQLQDFYRQVLVRPGFLPFLEAWEKDAKAGRTPPNMLEDEAYLAELMAPFREKLALAESTSAESADAGRTSDLYVLNTVLLAVSLFFAGVTGSFRSPTVRLLLLIAGFATLAIAAIQVIDLPIAAATYSLLGLA